VIQEAKKVAREHDRQLIQRDFSADFLAATSGHARAGAAAGRAQEKGRENPARDSL
jgi:hypothetical protein